MEQLQIQATELPMCRLCFMQGVELYEIFPGAANDNESLLIKIMDCVTVAVSIRIWTPIIVFGWVGDRITRSFSD